MTGRRRPTADDLLEALGEFLTGDFAARLSEADAFHLRVAANVLGMVRRELALGEAMAARIDAHYAAVLGCRAGTGEPATRLCRAIRDGEIAPDDPILLDALRAAAVARLSVDNPRYASYRRVQPPGE